MLPRCQIFVTHPVCGHRTPVRAARPGVTPETPVSMVFTAFHYCIWWPSGPYFLYIACIVHFCYISVTHVSRRLAFDFPVAPTLESENHTPEETRMATIAFEVYADYA